VDTLTVKVEGSEGAPIVNGKSKGQVLWIMSNEGPLLEFDQVLNEDFDVYKTIDLTYGRPHAKSYEKGVFVTLQKKYPGETSTTFARRK